jgi:glutathione synthase/RimK-type ligase-like ATP-grasp enzyme
MRLAIHHKEGSFSERWLEYCRDHRIDAEVVDCLSSDIIAQLASADGLLWHWSHGDHVDLLMARHVIQAAQTLGLKVFPDLNTCWHFDDKIAQKYLLEAIKAPMAPARVFYSLESARKWIDQARFPQVFKLRRGAGSANVQIVRDAVQAKKLARTMFAKGLKSVGGYFQDARTKVRKARNRREIWGTLRRMPKTIAGIIQSNREIGRERGYLYLQEFMPGNAFDTRVTVIGDRAFAFTRNVRPDDFRASGSGSIDYDRARIKPQCLQIAFDVAQKIKSQSMAFDFVNDPQGHPVILEISYGYQAKAVYDCGGFWDRSLTWHEGAQWPQDAILTDLVHAIES